jgi:phage-related protein
MSSYEFPSLSIYPTYPLDETREDGTISTPFEAGYVHTRPKFSRRGRKTYGVKYIYMPTTDKDTLDTFITSVREGAYTFTWVNPQSLTTVTVRFGEIPKFSYIINGYWECDFTLKEV